MTYHLIRIFFLAALGLFSTATSAMDIVRTTSAQSGASSDKRHIYPMAVLKLAMEKTVSDHGAYRIDQTTSFMPRDRALRELIKGDLINLFSAPTQQAWEEKTLPVRFPLRKGLLGYRLFLINRTSQKQLSNISTIDQLKQLRMGLGEQWSTTKAMHPLGFNIVTSINYESLFAMLSVGRFDYFPRGINEIFNEYEARRDKYPNMIIEPRLALYQPLPTYFFLSRNETRLAKRIETGLERALADGSFDELFQQYHEEAIRKSQLNNRLIFFLDNPNLSDKTPLARTELWIEP